MKRSNIKDCESFLSIYALYSIKELCQFLRRTSVVFLSNHCAILSYFTMFSEILVDNDYLFEIMISKHKSTNLYYFFIDHTLTSFAMIPLRRQSNNFFSLKTTFSALSNGIHFRFIEHPIYLSYLNLISIIPFLDAV